MTVPSCPQCVAPGCAHATTRGRLCALHNEKLGQTLADLASDLTASSYPYGTPSSTGKIKGGSLASERDPINLRLMDAQRQAPPVLAAWADWLLERNPDLIRTGGPTGDRTLLAHNLKWITQQPEVAQFWVQIRALWSTLRGHLPVRRCTCGGPVWSDRGGGWCSWCATSWAGRQLLDLQQPERAA